MARSHAKVLCSVWQDPSWCALKPREQWAFTMLLSQPKLSLVGCLDYMPSRWVTYGDGLTVDYLERCIAGLEAAGYVCVDHATFEILVRTFTRHDGIPISNERLRKGLWGAYEQVASARLRKVVVDNMPDEFFEYPLPAEAERFRRSERMEWAFEHPQQQAQEDPHVSPVSCSLSPVSSLLPPTTSTRSNGRSSEQRFVLPPTYIPDDIADLDPHETPRLDDEQRDSNLGAIAALKAQKGGNDAA